MLLRSVDPGVPILLYPERQIDMMPPMEIGIYGLGRFGSLWGSLLARRFSVTGYNRNGRRASPPEIVRVSEEEVCRADVLFLCVAISSLEEVLRRIAPRLREGTLVIDTCSVKVRPVELMGEILPRENPFLGCHPMFGPDSVGSGLQGLPVVLTPGRGRDTLVDEWADLLGSFGFRVIRLTPEEHDREAAYTQGITHLIGRVLKDVGLRESPIATLGYRKMLDVMEQTCNDPWQLFLDLQQYNPCTKEMRDRLQESIRRIMGQLETRIDS